MVALMLDLGWPVAVAIWSMVIDWSFLISRYCFWVSLSCAQSFCLVSSTSCISRCALASVPPVKSLPSRAVVRIFCWRCCLTL